MHSVKAGIGKLFYTMERGWNYFVRSYTLSRFKKVGRNVYIGRDCKFTEKTISIGQNVYIGKSCCFQSANGEILIGSHVLFGPGVNIHGGNHVYNQVGRFMYDINAKSTDSDGVVVIEDDVWIGANAIILKSVKVGQGSIVSAGSVVTKNVEPYSIVGGNPAQLIKMRFTDEEIEEHKKRLDLK
jgi:acetyltransferase-like isoleucine patch superfamily enzyme